jgi:hypothetical protein
MNEAEINLLELSADLWNGFLSLEKYHPNDDQEFCFHIHSLQRIIMSREAIRNNPNLFKTKGNEHHP